jgi:hypothetical protein
LLFSDEGGRLVFLAVWECSETGKNLEAKTFVDLDVGGFGVCQNQFDDSGIDRHGDLPVISKTNRIVARGWDIL